MKNYKNLILLYMKKKELIILALCFISLVLLLIIFNWGTYLINNDFIIESFFSEKIKEPYSNNANVNLPLNTSYSCKNFCGPTSRCVKTGQQCFTDSDCPGCQPYSPPLARVKNVRGENSAGKLTSQSYPNFSKLTTDIGTQAKIFRNSNVKKRAPQPNYGMNTWRSKFDTEQEMFDERYKPVNLINMQNYPYRYTLSGEFLTNGPLASNAYFE